MSELREVFEMVTKQTEPDVDAWKDQERRQGKAHRNKKIGAIAVVAFSSSRPWHSGSAR
jgi:hypothetical protein